MDYEVPVKAGDDDVPATLSDAEYLERAAIYRMTLAYAESWEEVISAQVTCDRCVSPGSCCKSVPLVKFFPDTATPADVLEEIRKDPRLNTFVPIRPALDGGWLFVCTALQPNGRCGVYETHPDLCKDFAPGGDPLCIHYVRHGELRPRVPMLDKSATELLP